jgi:hypothetical protein
LPAVVSAALVQKDALECKIVSRRAVEPTAAHLELGFLRDFEVDRREAAVRAARMHAGQPRPMLRCEPIGENTCSAK